jgi:hypothetical protein
MKERGSIVITKRILLAAICILLSFVILYVCCGGYIGSVMERRQELRDMAERLTNLQMSGGNRNYDYPVEDVISCISDELFQLSHDFTAAKNEYGEHLNNDPEDCLWFWFQSPPWTWERGYGQAGWMVLSKKDLRLIKFFLVIMN